jgi:hypothetical protein
VAQLSKVQFRPVDPGKRDPASALYKRLKQLFRGRFTEGFTAPKQADNLQLVE